MNEGKYIPFFFRIASDAGMRIAHIDPAYTCIYHVLSMAQRLCAARQSAVDPQDIYRAMRSEGKPSSHRASLFKFLQKF